MPFAFRGSEMNKLSDSYYEDVCAYSAYSNESYPYIPCSNDTDCGMRCSSSVDDYGSCTSDDDCSSGTCDQISCDSRALPHFNNGCGSPWGHSKGAFAFEEGSLGFFLQGTTPNWPDPSQGDTFAPLGCQLDNNVYLSQSFLGVTLASDDFTTIAPVLEKARLCSSGSLSCRNGSSGHMVDFNCTSEATRGEDWSILNTAFAATSTMDMPSEGLNITAPGGSTLRLFSHSAAYENPPWLLVANDLGVDLGVASWWDFNYGQATLCSGDDYSNATENYCLINNELGLALNTQGGAAQSVENAIAASFMVGGADRAWALWGEFSGIASHAKFGVAGDQTSHWVVSGDQNSQGFDCSSACNGSQQGRGGLFFAVQDEALHESLYDLLAIVCACNDFSRSKSRFCSFGCSWKNKTSYIEVEPTFAQTSSFWDANQKAWIP